MGLTPRSSHMGLMIILNQPVGITVGITNVSESWTSDLTRLIFITELNFSRLFDKTVAFLIYRFFLCSLLGFSWRFHRTRAGGTYWPLTGDKCPSCALMLLSPYRNILHCFINCSIGKGQCWHLNLPRGARAPLPPGGQAACAQYQCWCGTDTQLWSKPLEE